MKTNVATSGQVQPGGRLDALARHACNLLDEDHRMWSKLVGGADWIRRECSRINYDKIN